MNFYDVLAAEKWGGGVPTINFFDLLFAQSMGGGEQWKTYEGTLPATLNANGDDMRQYQIWGNTGGVGDKTINYFDYKKIDYTHIWDSYGRLSPTVGNNFCASPMIAVIVGNTYIRTYNLSPIGNVFYTYDAQKNFISREAPGSGVPFTIADGVAYIAYNIEVSNNYKASAYMLTEDTTLPETFVPFGYEVDIGVKSGNILDVETAVLKEYWINDDYNTFTYNVGSKCYFIPVSGNESYTITDFTDFLPADSFVFRVAFTNEIPTQQAQHVGHTYRKQRINSSGATKHSVSLTNNNYNYLAIHLRKIGVNNLAVSKGTTPPDEYQPYSNITTPIYIGDEPLDKDEYIDYQAGNIYRMINGVLTPTDPPVPLPALPTCEGETVVDYAGQSVAPEKVYFEYKGGKQP